jgi:hypothetical protein
MPWAIGGATVAGVYLASRKNTPLTADAELSAEEQQHVMQDSYTDADFQKLIGNLATTGGKTQVQVRQELTGPLEVVLEIRASGIEKFFAGDITPDVRKTAEKIASLLSVTCPGAPKLTNERLSLLRISDTSSGFKVRMAWPAIWSNTSRGPVREQVRACMEQLVRDTDKKIGERLLSLAAARR